MPITVYNRGVVGNEVRETKRETQKYNRLAGLLPAPHGGVVLPTSWMPGKLDAPGKVLQHSPFV
jgi:hypothetical protein